MEGLLHAQGFGGKKTTQRQRPKIGAGWPLVASPWLLQSDHVPSQEDMMKSANELGCKSKRKEKISCVVSEWLELGA